MTLKELKNIGRPLTVFLSMFACLFCSRIRQSLDKQQSGELTVEQIRRSVNIYLTYHHLPPPLRDEAFNKELLQSN
jgi:hypothetical protein